VYALFASAAEVYLCRDDTYAWFSRKMGSKEKGARLRRGYEQPHAVRRNLARNRHRFCATFRWTF